MKEGTKVKVLACETGHEFKIGEIVTRSVGVHEDAGNLGFMSETVGLWYMAQHEYEIVGTATKMNRGMVAIKEEVLIELLSCIDTQLECMFDLYVGGMTTEEGKRRMDPKMYDLIKQVWADIGEETE